jgi:DNA-directed RNA polymerase sigma subunit (sigma70/sigma32)
VVSDAEILACRRGVEIVVKYYIRRYPGRSQRTSAEDLRQIGWLAIVYAARKWDRARGITLWTYAKHYVQRDLQQHLLRPAHEREHLAGETPALLETPDPAGDTQAAVEQAETRHAARSAIDRVRLRLSERGRDVLQRRMLADEPAPLHEIALSWGLRASSVLPVRRAEAEVSEALRMELAA